MWSWNVATVIAAVLAVHSPGVRAEPRPLTYAEALADGARRMAANDVRGAVVAFQAALTARADDPRALSELSWASFLAGDLAAAGNAAALATYFAREPALRAMAFYNLGRVNEALREFVDAQGSYAASLALRDNREVRVRLKHLAPALLASHRLAGPFARPEDFCPTACEIERDPSPRWGGAAAISAPFRDAVKLDIPPAEDGWPRVAVALQLGDDWYVLPDLGAAAGGHGGCHGVELEMAGSRLVVHWHSEVGRFSHSDDRAMYVCGVGAAKQPSCVGPLVLEQREYTDHCGKDIDCTPRSTTGVWFNCRAEFHGDVIDVEPQTAKIEVDEYSDWVLPRPDACDALPISGKHTLRF
jgi:hypothetical protein